MVGIVVGGARQLWRAKKRQSGRERIICQPLSINTRVVFSKYRVEHDISLGRRLWSWTFRPDAEQTGIKTKRCGWNGEVRVLSQVRA